MRVKQSLSAVLASFALVACADDPTPSPGCKHVFWYKPKSPAAYVEVIGDFNEWRRPGLRLSAGRTDGYLTASIPLSAGELRYVFIEDGVRVLDPTVGTSAFRQRPEGGLREEVSWIEGRDCGAPLLRVVSTSQVAEGVEARVQLENAPGSEVASETLDPKSIVVTPAEDLTWSVVGNDVTLRWTHQGPGKKAFRVSAKDAAGRVTNDLRLSLFREEESFDPRDAVVYQIMVDRFRGPNGPLPSPGSPSARAGGTLSGIRAAIEKGELDFANVLWLSPLYRNPEGEFPGNDGRLYSSYHGYWPTSPRELDPRFGTEDDLRGVAAAAHARGKRVILDVVPNHVHAQHPYVARQGFTQGLPGSCTCGTATCDWGTNIDRCWFAPYLPDLDWRNDEMARQGADDIADWVERFDLDGVRIDAVPMMPRAATRRIAHVLRARFEHPGAEFWMVGENYTGPSGYDSLRYHLGPFGLDTEFHFPLMWALRSAIAEGGGAMQEIADVLSSGESAWAGSGAVMGLMIGNHDVPRFASVSSGESGGDPWSPAPSITDPTVYDKQALALGLTMTLPGAPFVYYGDEIGMPGRGDPDCRRVLPSFGSVVKGAEHVRALAVSLAQVRACDSNLRRGGFRLHYADREHLVFSREGHRTREGGTIDEEGAALVVATRTPFGTNGIEVPLAGIPEGTYVDALSAESISVRSSLTFLPGGPFSLHVFLAEGNPCLAKK